MGQVLDSISDSISFAFAPALLVYAEFHQSPGSSLEGVVSLACAVAILATGLFRLARFSAGGFQLSYFVGMPAPAAALFIVLTCLLFGTTAGSENPKFNFVISETAWLVFAVGFLASFLMASEIPYPKIHGWMATASGLGILLAILPYVAGLPLVGDQELYRAFSRTATGIALACTLAYVLGGPVYEKVKGGNG
jgi:CDP-diacylglycerol--serine O-phosphatidyltransferase